MHCSTCQTNGDRADQADHWLQFRGASTPGRLQSAPLRPTGAAARAPAHRQSPRHRPRLQGHTVSEQVEHTNCHVEQVCITIAVSTQQSGPSPCRTAAYCWNMVSASCSVRPSSARPSLSASQALVGWSQVGTAGAAPLGGTWAGSWAQAGLQEALLTDGIARLYYHRVQAHLLLCCLSRWPHRRASSLLRLLHGYRLDSIVCCVGSMNLESCCANQDKRR